MIGSARNIQRQEKKLLRLYSLWHATHDEKYKRQSLKLAQDIVRARPHFQIRNEFQGAF